MQSILWEKETHNKYIAMGLEKPISETILTQDKIFKDLAQAAKTDIYDIDTLKLAIERIHPERINNVKKTLEKIRTQNKDASFCEGINYALELLDYGGEEDYIEELE